MNLIKCKACFLLVVSIFLSYAAFCQEEASKEESEITALKKEISSANEKDKAKLILGLSEKYFYINSDTAFFYANQAHKLARKHKNKMYQAEALCYKGRINFRRYFHNLTEEQLDSALYIFTELNDENGISIVHSDFARLYIWQGKLDKAIEHLKKSEAYILQTNDTLRIIKNTNKLGVIHQKQGNYIKALEIYLTCAELSESIGNKRTLANAYQNIGTIYSEINETEKSLEYYKKAVSLHKELEYEHSWVNLYYNIANKYTELEKWDLALENINTYIKIKTELGEERTLTGAYTIIGDIHKYKGDFYSASVNYEKAIKLCYDANDSISIADLLNSIADLKYHINDYKNAIIHAKNALTYTNNLHTVLSSNSILFKSYEELGYYKEAYTAKKVYHQINDSISGLEVQKQLNELETKYETSQKENKIIRLQQENNNKEIALLKERQSKLILIGLLVFISLMSVFGFINYKKNQQQKQVKITSQKIELENRLLRAQINPHFIFNCLNSVQGYIVNKDLNKAIRYLSDFGSLVRSALTFSLHEMITIKDELNILEIFLNFEKERLGDKLQYSINIDKNIDIEVAKVPPMIIQPFVENSIKHGIGPKQGQGNIKITFKESNDNSELICLVEDNGVGRSFHTNKSKNSEHISLGQKLTKDRLKLFENKFQHNYNFEIIDLTKNNIATGTMVKIRLPYSSTTVN